MASLSFVDHLPARRTLSLLAASAILVGACGTAASPSPSASTAPSQPASEAPIASPTAAAPVEITVGYATGGNLDKYFETVLAGAKDALPGITVKTVVYPTYDDQLNQLPTQFAAGTVPDIIMWDNAAPVAQYASEKVITPLNDLVKTTAIDLSAYPKALVDGWTIDGNLYAVPAYLQNSGFVWNDDVLNAAGVKTRPSTMEEVATAAKMVKDKTGKAGVVILDNVFHIYQYIRAFGGAFNYGKTINSAENVAGLQFLVDLFANGSASTAKQLGATWDGEAISKNLAAMSDGGPWYIGFMKSTAPTVKYTIAAIPGGGGNPSFIVTYGGGFTITANAKDPGAAIKVVDFLTNEAAQKAILTTELGFVPARSSLYDQYVATTPEYAAFTPEMLAAGESLDYPVKTTEFSNDLVAGFEQLVLRPGSTTAKALLDSLQAKYGS